VTSITLAFLLTTPTADPTPPQASKPVGVTRDEEKALLDKHKKAKPRLPMPPADPDNPLARVNNGAFRAYYLPAELRESRGTGGAREADPAMTLDNTFKVKLFWITSRANNCYYCLAHQEYKLLGAGQTDDDIAALDGDWLTATPKERIAYEFTRKLTHTPHAVTTADVESMKKHYTEKEVLEILVTVAGYNSTNRWTDGLNIPAEADGARFKKEGSKADFSTFLTPTSEKYAKQKTTVGPMKVPGRTALEPRDKVEAIWKEKRTAVLPLADAKAAAEVWGEGAAPNWAALLANFPKSMKGRVTGLRNAMDKGNLSAKLKGQIAWVAARHDRAWYALSVAREQLAKAGVSEGDIWKLDGDRKHLTEGEQAALTLAETLTVAPWAVTDEMVERCRKHFKDAEVAEIVYRACNAAFFDRVTEVARLPLDK
jgi:alkylhydroperoxidase family enzyme